MPKIEFAYLLWLVSMLAFTLFHLWQRRRWQQQLARAERAARPAQPARPSPAAATLGELEAHAGRVVGSALLGRRLARLCALLSDASLVQAYLSDPTLAHQVETGTVANNSTLFRCLAALEENLEGQTFRGNPVNTLGAYLRAEFRKRGWAWPRHPHAWREFFQEHALLR